MDVTLDPETTPVAAASPTKPRFATTFEAFGNRTYRIVWLGTILAFLAFNISMTAQGVVAYDLTGRNGAVGTVLLGQGIAMLFLNPFGGAIADRFPKRLLLMVAQAVIGFVALTTAILIMTDHISITFLAIGAFLVGSMFSFLGPTRMALIGEIMPEERMGNAMALVQVGGNFSRITGPFLAGALLSIGIIGPAGTYLIIAGIFIFVIATFYQVPKTQTRKDLQGASVLDDVRIGFRYVTRNPRLLHTVLSFHIVTVLGMSQIVLMPGFAKDVLHAGTGGFGALLGVAAAGGLGTSLVVASLSDSKRAPFYLTISSFGLGIALMLTGVAPTFPLALLTMFLVGGAASAFQTLNNVVAVQRTEPEFFGRVIALIFLAWGLNSVFTKPIGILGDMFGERTMLCALGASLCVAVALLALWGRLIEKRLGPENGVAPQVTVVT